MKNLTKFTGIFAIIIIIGLFIACDDINGSINNGGNTGTTPQTPSSGLLFTLIDGPAYAVSIGTATDVHIVIPSKHNDLPVTEIKEQGFMNSSILSVSIPSIITSIGNSAFYGCIGLTSITIPNSVTFIGMYAFSGCTGLTNITIGSGITSIDLSDFYSWTRLTSITVHESNSNYSSQNGILYNKAKTTLIRAPQGLSGSITIPNSVTSVYGSAFRDCTYLSSVTIPISVTSFNYSGPFAGWTSSQTIYIPFATLAEANIAWRWEGLGNTWRDSCNAKIINNAGVQVYP